MKKRALVSLVLLVSILMLMAETVIFQEDQSDPAHCVDGHVHIYNPETGQWNDSNGERVFIEIFSPDYQYRWPGADYTFNGYYLVNCSAYAYASLCTKVKVIYRGQTYISDFCYATGTTVDIWFYPDR